MRELIIDRFEENFVVCHTPDGQLEAFSRKRLPADAKEGSCIVIAEDGSVTVDIEKTLRYQAMNMYKLKNMLVKRKPRNEE